MSLRKRLRIEDTSDLWWKNAIVYCLDVETFLDSNGDGVGDLGGLIERIDYLAGLGVSCLWLMPFYPSPNRDDGYDVADYYAIDPRLGDMGDFVELVHTARDRGLRVIADLVVNHTSVEHPWFQSARSSRDSPYREFYVWRDEPTDEFDSVSFPGEQESNWSWDEKAGQYYLHRFYAHQPDLNIANPDVLEEIQEIAAFWLRLGLAGFRVDAVPFLLELEGIERKREDIVPHDLLRQLTAFLTRRKGDILLLGEVNAPPKEARRYFGNGDELQMIFSFNVNQRLYLSLARQSADAIREGLRELPEIPPSCGFANFVSNHDELSLDQLTDEEREEVFAAFAPDENMRMYGRGIRRRLPAMLNGDPRRIRMVYSLLLSLPGTPVIYYGEEIGMVENLEAKGRWSVRTPMQWSAERHGGFSDAEKIVRPHATGRYAPERINVSAQRRDDGSLLSWMRRMIGRRRECPEIGFGTYQVLSTGDSAVLAHTLDWCESTLLLLHNFSPEERTVRLQLELPKDFVELVELASDSDYPPATGNPTELSLAPYGYRWLRVRRAGRRMLL